MEDLVYLYSSGPGEQPSRVGSWRGSASLWQWKSSLQGLGTGQGQYWGSVSCVTNHKEAGIGEGEAGDPALTRAECPTLTVGILGGGAHAWCLLGIWVPGGAHKSAGLWCPLGAD